jgi:alkanesulfonate monooxygenase SsuD/methylene tetrahydromethanopterin reductase-like flavin-dependent oxidoreductase (luciferase family)
MRFSAAKTVCCGRDDAEVERRAAAIGRPAEGMRAKGDLAGTPAQIVDTIGGYARAGAETIYLQVLDLSDVEHLELLAAEVMPQV